MAGLLADRQDLRLHEIDILKAISILLVLITHLRWTDLERKFFLFPFFIEMGVPFFMMISGYVGAVFLDRTGKVTLTECYSEWSILKKILAYTFPFFVCVSGELVLKFLWSGQTYPVVKTFICGGIGPGSYYYPCLIQYVLTFPIVFIIIKRNKEKGLLFLLITNIMYEIFQSFYGMDGGCYRLLFMRYLFCIAYGCYLALGKEWGFYWYVDIIAMIAGVVWIFIIEYKGFEPAIFKYWRATNVIASLFFAVLFRLGMRMLSKCRLPFIEYIGKNTWYIFLVQMVFFSGINIYFYKLIPGRILGFVGAVMICIIGGIIFSIICKPVSKWIINYVMSAINRIGDMNLMRFIVK